MASDERMIATVSRMVASSGSTTAPQTVAAGAELAGKY
jgi:hypothetical protein